MTKQARINVTTLVNASKIRREKRDGRDVIIVPSATLPDNVVMNSIRYPADVIEASYHTLEGTPAPLGHPSVNGQFVSASDPKGLVRSFVGAWNENVHRKDGRVFLDKVIDVEYAGETKAGQRVLNAIEGQKPIHTSTGLLATMKAVENATDGAKFEVESMVFDHDCILLDEDGAATPDQGVGIFVNAQGEEIEVINSDLESYEDEEINYTIDRMLRAAERKQRQPLIERIKKFITEAVQGGPTPDTTEGDALNNDEDDMDKAQFDALSEQVGNMSETLASLDDKIAAAVGNALKPLTDQMAANAKAAEDKAEADRLELVNKVVEAKLLDEAVAKDATAPVLNALLEKAAQPTTAFRVNGGYKPASNASDGFKLPEGD